MTPTLSTCLRNCRLSETDAMNLLQSHGKVSDLCVTMDDIAEADVGPACKWLYLVTADLMWVKREIKSSLA